jgi:hypothetical protein
LEWGPVQPVRQVLQVPEAARLLERLVLHDRHRHRRVRQIH